MKKFELPLGIISIIAIAMRLLHLPGNGLLVVLSLSILALFYYLSFAFFNGIRLREIFKHASYNGTNAKRIIGAVGLGFALSGIITGALFKLCFWAGGDFQLGTGLIAVGIILILAIFFYFRNKIDYYKRVFKRIAIIGGLGLILYITPTATLVDIYYRNNPDYAEIYKKVLNDPHNQELIQQLHEKRQEMNQ